MEGRYYLNVGGEDFDDRLTWSIESAREIAIINECPVKCYDIDGELCYTIDAQGNVKKEE